MYDPKIIIDLISRNVGETGNPFATIPLAINRWWRGLNLPERGHILLVTGLMIQFLPLIRKAVLMLEKFEDTDKALWIKYAKYVPIPFVQLASLFALLGKKDTEPYRQMLIDITDLLKSSGIRFAYRPELDFYSGILLYDLGDEDAFAEHAYKVARALLDAGVRSLITIDPHTTYAFKVLYPRYVGVKFNVYTYIELLNPKGNGFKGLKVTLHDPCFFGRYLSISHVPRRVLGSLGVEVVDVQQSGMFTHCCGGPLESISPKLSITVAGNRLEQLQKTGQRIITMCPICFENLRRAGGDVEDLAGFLRRYMQ